MRYGKAFGILGLSFLLSMSASFAQEQIVYKTAPAFVRVTTNLLGYNFIAKKVAQGVLRRALKKSVLGDYKIKFDSFSGVDLKKGIFRGLVIDGKNLSIDDELFISNLHIETTSKFNYVDYRQKPMVFMTDLPMVYNVVITEEDLNRSVNIEKFFDVLSSLMPLVSFEKPKIKLEKNKLRLSSALKIPFSKPVKFSMSTALKVVDGKIVMSDVEATSKNELTRRIMYIINKQNILENISIYVFDDADTTVSVSEVKIDDNKLYINGNLLIKKS